MKTLLILFSLLIPVFGFSQEAKLPEHIIHNDFCSGEEEENCYYLHGELEHTCTDKCKANYRLVDHKHNEVCYVGEDQCSFAHGERGHDCEHRRCNVKGDGRAHDHNDSCRPYQCHYAHGEKRHICTDYCKTLADHVCNDKCNADACYFEHGEKGHTCTQECYNKEAGDGHDHSDGHSEEHSKDHADELVDHQCNDMCSAEACNFVHGELGHVCGKECKAKKAEHGHAEDGHEHDH